MFDIDEVRASSTGSPEWEITRYKDILSDEEPALTERVRLFLSDITRCTLVSSKTLGSGEGLRRFGFATVNELATP